MVSRHTCKMLVVLSSLWIRADFTNVDPPNLIKKKTKKILWHYVSLAYRMCIGFWKNISSSNDNNTNTHCQSSSSHHFVNASNVFEGESFSYILHELEIFITSSFSSVIIIALCYLLYMYSCVTTATTTNHRLCSSFRLRTTYLHDAICAKLCHYNRFVCMIYASMLYVVYFVCVA